MYWVETHTPVNVDLCSKAAVSLHLVIRTKKENRAFEEYSAKFEQILEFPSTKLTFPHKFEHCH